MAHGDYPVPAGRDNALPADQRVPRDL